MDGLAVAGLDACDEEGAAVFDFNDADVCVLLLQAGNELLTHGQAVCRTAATAAPVVVLTEGVGAVLAEARFVSGRLAGAKQCAVERFVNL